MAEIFGTLGPACDNVEILEKMFDEGMTGMRLNMSHKSLQESKDIIHRYHTAAKNKGIKADLLIDMQGPEQRIGILETPIILENASLIYISNRNEEDVIIPIPSSLYSHLEVKDHILIDDGKIELEVIDIEAKKVLVKVLRGGLLESKKSIKIVNKNIYGAAVTAQDRRNIHDAQAFGVTSVMQPFVRNSDELRMVKDELKRYGLDDIRVFAKIENKEGLENLEDIITEADMIVIARGDLGNDMPLWELPRAQKRIEKVCKKAHKPFLVVTQMLASMVHSAVPTRAEVSDIFNAIEDGASAVMVTNETAVGDYPVEVIKYLSKTVENAEEYYK